MNAIEVKNVYKSFKVYYDKGATLKEKILFKKRNRHEVHDVLKGIDITIKKGEVVGFIGENGCGKSTLLKLMTRIIYPDKGSIQVKGKVSSLIELGAGFHQDMSGRENIYTNASIFGLTKKEIDQRIEEIIEFSELGDFIENPVRTYSSGMYMRLAFSVAINVDADILLIDEILAVGDASFQAKCFNKLQEIKQQGTTIVIVSHDSSSIEKLCNRAIWIKDGFILHDGRPRDTMALYLDNIMNGKHTSQTENKEATVKIKQEQSSELMKDENRTGNLDVEIKRISLKSLDGEEKIHSFKSESGMSIQIEYKRHNKTISKSVVGMAIFRCDGVQCYGTNTYIDSQQLLSLKDEGIVEIKIDSLQLLENKYLLDIAFHDENGVPYDYIRRAVEFYVYTTTRDAGVFRMNHTIRSQE